MICGEWFLCVCACGSIDIKPNIAYKMNDAFTIQHFHVIVLHLSHLVRPFQHFGLFTD